MTELHAGPDKPMTNPSATPADSTETQLVASIVAGDGAAFERLMRQYNRRLFRLARSVLRNDAEAEDALQDSFLAAYRKLHQFRGDASLSTWLSRLVLNECLGRRRKDARRDVIVPMLALPADTEPDDMAPAADDTPDVALGRTQMRALLERKLDALPEAFRTVFMLRCVEELSVEETAAALDIPEATVRTRHFRARGLLRESLAREIDLAERDLFGFDGKRCDRIVNGVFAKLAGHQST
jgi:RNA polymerase sigma-70 factor, ECF subfamily